MSEILMTSSNTGSDEQTFENAMEKLESHVRTLELGKLTLAESLKVFEEGMKLAQFCTNKLNEAESKIKILLEKDGEIIQKEFKIEE